MAITLNGTTGITTPDITSEAGLTVDGVSFASGAPANTLVTTSDGNVGIGTSSPVTVLQVGQTEISSIPTSSFSTHQNIDGDAVNYFFNSTQATSGSTNETTQLYLGWRDAASGIGVAPRIVAGKEGDYTTAGNAKAYLSFSTVSNNSLGERARIDSSGNLLVGTTSANGTEKFNVTSASTEVAFFQNSSNTSGYSGIRSNIGSGGSNTSTWHFRGETRGYASYYLYGNGTTSYSSDIRLKKNVQTARGYLEDLNKLRVVKYQWKGEDPDCQQVELGLIAQEVEEVFPNLIQEHEVEGVGNMKHIKQSVLPFMMLKAIQEQQAIIEALTARVSALEASNV